MKWTALWLALNLACVGYSLTLPVMSATVLINAFAAGLLTVVLLLEWLERD
jgi:hypothetical protein